ncbi:MAG: RNA methyltransferase [Planctomycetota bacterium]|nr:MAG: RNA methyltransferase [Planctomycetota bacterium]
MAAVEPVLSPQNPRLKSVRAIRSGRNREDLLLEGLHLLEEALAAGFAPKWVLFDSDWSSAEKDKLQALVSPELDCRPCDPRLLREVSDLDSPPGLLAVAPRPSSDWQASVEQAAARKAWILVAAGVQDPGNTGAMVRVAAGLGARAFFALKGGASPWHPRALRGASGTTFRLPVADGLTEADLVACCRRNGVHIWATDAGGEDLRRVRRSEPVVLLLGEEGRGLTPYLEQSCQRKIGIVMDRGVESLNVATAAAVCAFVLGNSAPVEDS